MHTYTIGKKSRILINREQCPGVNVYFEELSREEMGHMCCDIQKELYFIYIINGEMNVQVNQECMELHKGEGLFINRDSFYRYAGGYGNDCTCYRFSVSEDMFENNPLIEKYVLPVIESEDFSYMKLDAGKDSGILELLKTLGELAQSERLGKELMIKSGIYQMMALLYESFRELNEGASKAIRREKEKLSRMLEYLHENYKNKITLTEIAENLGVSSGDYCRFFKKHMGQTPFEYLQMYRIEKTIPELLEKSESITDISLRHGFNGSSYYAETFRKEMGCTPGEFRKWYLGEEGMACPLKVVQVGNIKTENKNRKSIQQKKAITEMPTHLL